MIYLIGLIPGAIAGIAISLYASKSMKIQKEIRWKQSEIKAYPLVIFIVVTFIFGPALSFLYYWKFNLEGISAIWFYSLSNTFNLFFGSILLYWINKKWGKYIHKKTGSWINKEIWKESLISILIFVFTLIWLLPLIINRIFAGTFV